MMGLTAAIFNPIGTGLALVLSQLVGRRDGDEQSNVVECIDCGATLELSEQEVAQGHYNYPECDHLAQH
jgi:hypothetical protein